ncbi:MAG: ABC transporter permease [Candidatus Methanofastidiosia archaeon]|jgi:ABC-2 type transport system permease protein
MKNDIFLIKEEIRKNIKILLCYPVEIMFWAIFPVLWVIPFIFQGEALVGGITSSHFGDLAGTDQFIPFVLIGAIVSTYLFSSLYGMGGSIRMESYWGTLEFILGSPARKISVLMGKALSESISSTLFVMVQMVICVFGFGVSLTVNKLLPIVLVMLLLVAGLYGMAIALAGVTLQIKESRSLVHTIEYLFYLFSPIRYPVGIHPFIAAASLVIPLTYALIAIRGVWLLNQPMHVLWKSVILLAVLDVVFISAGYSIFYFMEKKVRKSGTVAQY